MDGGGAAAPGTHTHSFVPVSWEQSSICWGPTYSTPCDRKDGICETICNGLQTYIRRSAGSQVPAFTMSLTW